MVGFNRGDERKYPPRGEGRREGKPGDRRGKVPPEVKPQPPKAVYIYIYIYINHI